MFIVWMLRSHGGERLFGLALALILGGAVGNVIDRLLHGYVVDFTTRPDLRTRGQVEIP